MSRAQRVAEVLRGMETLEEVQIALSYCVDEGYITSQEDLWDCFEQGAIPKFDYRDVGTVPGYAYSWDETRFLMGHGDSGEFFILESSLAREVSRLIDAVENAWREEG